MQICEQILEFSDELGPEKIIHLYEPRTGMKAIVVVDNTAAGLPHGGGKSGIIADPKTVNKEQLIRTFARSIKNLRETAVGIARQRVFRTMKYRKK